MKTIHALVLGLLLFANAQLVIAQTTGFTYQGKLAVNGAPASGNFDVKFALFEFSEFGFPAAPLITNANVAVDNGLFTTTLDFGTGVFTGTNYWLEIGVRTNGSAEGFTTLVPRQAITPTPYAINAATAASATTAANVTGNIPDSQLSGNIARLNASQTFTGSISANSFSGDGTGLNNVNAGTLNGLNATNFWKNSGNAGTVAGTDFFGTTDNQPLEIKVNGMRAARLEPTVTADTVNVIGGSQYNFVGAGVVGATIGGGGGRLSTQPGTNRVESNFSTVAGGYRISINTQSAYGTIGGGTDSRIRFGQSSTIGGGDFNTIDAQVSTISGGHDNWIRTNAGWSTVGGGIRNWIGTNASYSAIGGGGNNLSTGPYSIIPGGDRNEAGTNSFAAGQRAKAIHKGSFVWADPIEADFSTTATNQFLMRAAGGVGINKNNPATALDVNGTVTATAFSGSGANLTALSANNLSAGTLPDARLSSNVPRLNSSPVFTGDISGARLKIGGSHTLNGSHSTIAGGQQNITSDQYQTISGGFNNRCTNAFSSIVGGADNISGGFVSTVAGGNFNRATGSLSFAAGHKAAALHNGSFVWGDNSTDNEVVSNSDHSWTVRASGGVRLFSNSATSSGVVLNSGDTAWSTISDRNAKKNFHPVAQKEVLEKLAAMPVQYWNYTWESDEEVPHIGPMAQDFKAAFFPGRDDKSITTQEVDGVALAAIQGLNEKVEARLKSKDIEIELLRNENLSLAKRLADLEHLVRSLPAQTFSSTQP